LAQLDFKKGKITIKLKEDTSLIQMLQENSIVLNLTGNTVSLPVQSNIETHITISSANINRTLGDEKLYLKGGEGSMAILELFGPDADNNGVADELETIRNSGWLINRLNLVFMLMQVQWEVLKSQEFTCMI
jgi:hypothetical protein